jgi:hypothetical protein
VVREALRLMEEQDQIKAAKLDRLRRDVRAGLDSACPKTPVFPSPAAREIPEYPFGKHARET